MKPEEKAKELIEKFMETPFIDMGAVGLDTLTKREAKHCALICVEEIINSNPENIFKEGSDPWEKQDKYWQKVKQSIKEQ